MPLVVACLMGTTSGCSSRPAAAGGNSASPAAITADETCPVCGMAPANYPAWQSLVLFVDGEHRSFECPRDMLLFINNMSEYDPGHDRKDIRSIFVKDFATGAWIDARKAHFVAGSVEKGPMGEDFIPFALLETSRQFIRSKSGQVLVLRQINNDVLDTFIPAGQR
ncbi:nitrous oxide reductase accessory protein NosL [Geothermobacter hydrogeniphilus]|nr:nitrous oxide reductase accessory protein NosL [Geothermobacter hydrogeniphilus]